LTREIEEVCRQARIDAIEMMHRAGSGHPGGSLSCAEILACLLFHQAHLVPEDPRHADRDRVVVSKGHAAPMLYALLAARGFFDRRHLDDLRRCGAMLQGHPDMRKTPGVDMTSGSLGQGISAACGMALGARMRGLGCRVFVVLGDGETNEGQVWEAALFAAHYGLGNLTAIVDHNDLQLDGPCRTVMSHDPLHEKWRAFCWRVLAADGHSVPGLLDALDESARHAAGPTVIIADTVKGKGVSFMENRAEWHGKPISAADRDRALAELRGAAG
jgi:transketolase